MLRTACVLVANGSEEMESVITIDVLRRGGIVTTVAGIDCGDTVKCSRDVVLKPDTTLDAVKDNSFDIIVLPGGVGGANAFCKSQVVGELLKQQECSGRWLAAICAAPTAFKAHGVGLGKRITCYPAMADALKEGGKYCYVEDTVVVDGKMITSRGPGTAIPFALTLVNELVGGCKAKEVAAAMLVDFP